MPRVWPVDMVGDRILRVGVVLQCTVRDLMKETCGAESHCVAIVGVKLLEARDDAAEEVEVFSAGGCAFVLEDVDEYYVKRPGDIIQEVSVPRTVSILFDE